MLGVSASMGMLRNTEASGVSAQSGRLRVAGRFRLRVTPSCDAGCDVEGADRVQVEVEMAKREHRVCGGCTAALPASSSRLEGGPHAGRLRVHGDVEED